MTELQNVTCFGGSTLCGYGDRDTGEKGWCGRLKDRFVGLNHTEEVVRGPLPSFYDLSVMADTTTAILARIAGEWDIRGHQKHKRLGVLAVGTSDSLQFHSDGGGFTPRVELAVFKDNLARIVEHMLIGEGNKVLYVGITPFDEARTTSFKGRDISYVNEITRQYEQAAVGVVLDSGMHAVPLMASAEAFDFTAMMLDPDGLHPNTLGHEWIANQVIPVAESVW